MKTSIPILITASLLTLSCKKQEEAKPAPVVTAPDQAPEKKTRQTVVPGPPAPDQPGLALQSSQPQAPPPTEEELQTFLADLRKLAGEVAQLPADAALTPEVETMQKSYTALIQRRNVLMAGMNDEEKKKLLLELSPLARTIGPTLVRLRFAKSREQMKNLPRPEPGTTQPASPLGDLAPRLNTPPEAPPDAPPAPQPPANPPQ